MIYFLVIGGSTEHLLPLLSFDSFQEFSMRYSERTNVSAFILLYFEVDLNSSRVWKSNLVNHICWFLLGCKLAIMFKHTYTLVLFLFFHLNLINYCYSWFLILLYIYCLPCLQPAMKTHSLYLILVIPTTCYVLHFGLILVFISTLLLFCKMIHILIHRESVHQFILLEPCDFFPSFLCYIVSLSVKQDSVESTINSFIIKSKTESFLFW